MEVFNQRLEQEYGAEVIVTVPSVPYKSINLIFFSPAFLFVTIDDVFLLLVFLVGILGEKNIKKYGAKEIILNNPADFPDVTIVDK